MAAPGYPSPVAGYQSPPYPTPPYPASPSAPPAPPTPGFHDYPGPGCSIPPHHHLQPSIHPQPDPPPGGAPYMPVSSGSAPSALEYLSQIDQILIHQKTELLEAVTGFETCNQYELRNIMGQRIFTVQERSSVCARLCCGPRRPLTLHVCDYSGREVIHFIRPLKCNSCLFPCCLQELEVQSPPGHTIGYVVQTWHPFVPKYCLQTESREPVLKVVGPCLMSSCCGDVNFQVKPLCESRSVGRISKQWGGLPKEIFTDADNFGIQFPKDLDVKMKAVLLGACFILDYAFFERSRSKKERHTVIS
ncbi:phospholipid scramblase 1-like [Mixophyes fleayi]|uniref:phospholipid scramblase 1-like n=1 Tax=Mixophyes fleayi TaxID=3061075 RepID=UPI003F4E1C64